MTHPTIEGAGKWVLVPGTLCTDRVFDPLLQSLGVARSVARVIPVDAPDVQDYDQPLRKAVTGAEIVCGFSLGAMVLAHNLDALKAARAIVLLASNPFPDPPGNRANREMLRDRVMAGGATDWVRENWASMSISPRADHPDLVAAMAEDTAHLIAAQMGDLFSF